MRWNMRAEVSLCGLLLAFEFGSRSEPEFVASTVRPARMVPQPICLFADHLFILVHVPFSRRWRSHHYAEIACLFRRRSTQSSTHRSPPHDCFARDQLPFSADGRYPASAVLL